jgi:acyl dehydratase
LEFQMTVGSIHWEDVIEGADLPSFTYELSLLRLVAFVRASGLYDYIHFDRDYAQSVGMRDAFISTPHISGLFSRLLTDWSGPGGEIRSMTMRMASSGCAGDILTVAGKVGRKYVSDDGEHLVDIEDITLGTSESPRATVASATMALPTRDTAVRAPALQHHVNPPVAVADTPAFARDLIGQVTASRIPETSPLTEHEIVLWCEALEDWNPMYWNHDLAQKSRHGGIVAPPAMGVFFGHGGSVAAGIGVKRPGVEVPAPIRAGLTGLPLLQELRKQLIADNNPYVFEEFPEAAVSQAREDFYRSVRPGDSLHDIYRLANISPLKKTRVGEGHFVKVERMSYNQRDELVKVWTIDLYMYRTTPA